MNKKNKKPNGYWTLERCKQDALLYKSKIEWKNNSTGYSTALKNRWLKLCCQHMVKSENPKKFLTLDYCKKDSLRFNSICQWKTNSASAYAVACRNKWLNECCSHMFRPKPIIRLTFDFCKNVALKYKSKVEWYTKDGSTFATACRNKWIDDCCKHMVEVKKPNGWWTKPRCKADALLYLNKISWKKSNTAGYSVARKNGWLEECCQHMKPLRGSSMQEKELLDSIRKIYPEAQKKFFKSNPKEFFQHRFELDIYIPSLNVGIEFNGTYWHGKGFKRFWTSDPDEYHGIKRQFFKIKNINYLEIEEIDWLKDKEDCIKKALKFLAKSNT